ncbi:hypothetical protein V6N13_049495 [Hibiscus sabdariffa]|uniref:Uncharacterized protein n=1 Tax=Hibiscus sabdariffa TaxID=183260 RepID=A0ABR2QX45_9ROSI
MAFRFGQTRFPSFSESWSQKAWLNIDLRQCVKIALQTNEDASYICTTLFKQNLISISTVGNDRNPRSRCMRGNSFRLSNVACTSRRR